MSNTETETVTPETADVEKVETTEINSDGDRTNSADGNADNVETVEVPRFEMPKSKAETDMGDPLINSLFAELWDAGDAIKSITMVLAQQTENFSPDKLLVHAETSQAPEIQKAWAAYSKALARLEDLKKTVQNAVIAEIGDEKLSEEDIAAKVTEKKTKVEFIGNTKKALAPLVDMKIPAGDMRDYAHFFLENFSVPGVRSGSSGSTTSVGSGATQKPRLNGGTIAIGGENFDNFSFAAKAIAKATNKPVTSNDLVVAWLAKEGTTDWKSTPIAPQTSTFTFEGKEIVVLRNE